MMDPMTNTTQTETGTEFSVMGFDPDSAGWYVTTRWPRMTRAQAEGVIRRVCESNPHHTDCLPGHCAMLRVDARRAR